MHASEQHWTLRLLVVCLSGKTSASETLVIMPLNCFLHVGQTRFPSLSNCSRSTRVFSGFSFVLVSFLVSFVDIKTTPISCHVHYKCVLTKNGFLRELFIKSTSMIYLCAII